MCSKYFLPFLPTTSFMFFQFFLSILPSRFRWLGQNWGGGEFPYRKPFEEPSNIKKKSLDHLCNIDQMWQLHIAFDYTHLHPAADK